MRAFGMQVVTVQGPEAASVRCCRTAITPSPAGRAGRFLIGPFFHRGLMLLDFDEHHRHRRIMQQAFTAERLARLPRPDERDARPTASTGWHRRRDFRFYPALKQLTLDVATAHVHGRRARPGGRPAQPGVRRLRACRHRRRPRSRARPAVVARAGRAQGARAVPLPAHRRPSAPATATTCSARSCHARGRGRRDVQRRRHRQPHDLPADGRARHHDDHDDHDGLLPGQAPGVAGAVPGRVAGARHADASRYERSGSARRRSTWS